MNSIYERSIQQMGGWGNTKLDRIKEVKIYGCHEIRGRGDLLVDLKAIMHITYTAPVINFMEAH